jgi:signal transduction histidine kinase
MCPASRAQGATKGRAEYADHSTVGCVEAIERRNKAEHMAEARPLDTATPATQDATDPYATIEAQAQELARLQRRLQRARQTNQILEDTVEDQIRSVYLAKQDVDRANSHMDSVLRCVSTAIVIADTEGRITSVRGSTERMSKRSPSSLIGAPVGTLLEGVSVTNAELFGVGECNLQMADGSAIPVLLTTSQLLDESNMAVGTVHVASDLRRQKKLEMRLAEVRKLESIGQLAAGVAHEMNTPIQYVGDSAHFLDEVVEELLSLQAVYSELVERVRSQPDLAELVARIDDAESEADLDFLREEAPGSVARIHEGVARVSEIVRAMKQFSNQSEELVSTDVNSLIDSTLTVAKNEFKYVADVDRDLGPLPSVLCSAGGVGQVVLNLVVNAAHAITDRIETEGGRGNIRITTRHDEVAGTVQIDIADSGGGIPDAIAAKVFDPFFTTKEVGKGTGQGLAISHNIIVERHRGSLTFTSEPGVGTTFHIVLPVGGPS